MAEIAEIKRVAEQAARRAMLSTPIVEVHVEPEIGPDGDDLVRVRIIIPDDQANLIDFAQFFDATLKIKDSVRAVGDERRALVGFITPSELEHRDDAES